MVETGNREIVEKFFQALNAHDWESMERFLDAEYVWEMPQSGERIRGLANNRTTTENYPGLPNVKLIGSPGARTSGSRRPALRFSRSLVRVTTTRRGQSPPTRMGAYGTRSTFSTSVQERSSTTSPTSRPPWKLLSGGPAGWSASKAFHVLWTRNRQAGVVTQHSTDHDQPNGSGRTLNLAAISLLASLMGGWWPASLTSAFEHREHLSSAIQMCLARAQTCRGRLNSERVVDQRSHNTNPAQVFGGTGFAWT